MRLYLDPGHGGTDSGATGNGLLEKNINLDIALRIGTILLNNYENVNIRMSRTGDTTVSLQQRTNDANTWGADYFLSIHCNAFNGTAYGYEDFIYSGLSDSSPTARYRDSIHTEVTRVNQLYNRGKKKDNFHVLRESNMPAMLTENGFIDHTHDSNLMKQSSWLQTVAQGHVNGLAIAFNLQRKPDDSDVFYKVIAGSFKSRENAEERVAFLNSRGIDSFVATVTISGEVWYRAQAGAFSTRQNAEVRLNEVKNAGIEDAYIISEQQSTVLVESTLMED
ncbi:N-acetylmuramoyl-L-alanine amidase [Ornithinibacillus sp. L9]|uniref:N-acetylmuramoyl-L-alanine amidase n=1 Tax=Ornithinibacillus caprae TaxID=2678566 RepID=A0A6N8FD52_9BACI|nr:N-acetylmuramoyl-L-alanine amidase [Ornithinibacillus caprae]MUK87602.1 N-acetylmuramoyl-L-alanine amidase [Ornithinibacillus caprae]